MTVDEAIDGFIEFFDASFERPASLSGAPVSLDRGFMSAKAKGSFLEIISRSLKTSVNDAQYELFESRKRPNGVQT